ncbi:MAK10-like protein [Tanacetum coccineum]
MVPLRSETIRLVQKGCLFHGLRSEDPNQYLKDLLKLVDSLDLYVTNRERTRLRLFQFSLRDQAINCLERLPTGSISIWEDLTTRFLAQFFPPGRTKKLCNDILMFQQHQGESLSKTWIQSWALLEDLALYDNKSWNDTMDFTKPVKAISLPQDIPSTSDRCLIELENQVQRLMEAHLAPKQPIQVNKITSSCEIYNGPYDTQYCMENPEQAFVEYASSLIDEAGSKWYTFKPEQNNLGDTYNPSWKSHPNLRWRQPQNSQNNFSNPLNWFQPNGSFPNRSFNNNPQIFNNQTNLKILVSNFMASQDARLSKFEVDFKQQQSEMTNKINTVLKAITDRITGALSSDTVKNPKLNINSTSLVLFARSYPIVDPQCSSHAYNSINAVKKCSNKTSHSQKDQPQPVTKIRTQRPKETEQTLEDEFKDFHLNLPVLEVLAHAPILGNFEPFDTLADLGACVNIIPLYLFKKLNIGLLEETNHVFRSRNPLLVGRGFLETTIVVIDCRKAKIAVGEGITSLDGVGARAPYYARKDFLDCHLSGEWEIARDAEINQFKDALDKPPKNGDKAWHAKIRLIDQDREEFTKTLQSVPTSRKLSEREDPKEIIDLDHFYDTLYLMRRSLEVHRKFHWTILGGRFNHLSHVSSPLLSKPGEY